MKLTVPFNGEGDLIPRLCSYPQVAEVYGKLTADCIGGGKSSFQVPCVTRRRLAAAVKETHRHQKAFNYLLNSSCLGNLEWTSGGQRQIRRLLDWLAGLQVDAVTVTVPYLLVLLKKQYPALKVCISTLAGVNTALKAKYWEELGADRITLFNVDVNRNFPLIGQVRKNVACELSLILNANCIHQCPFSLYHANLTAHASQSGHPLRGYAIDYPRIMCRYRQITSPVDLIRSSWIRPEDVSFYEALGIDYFKIIDRGMTTDTLVSILDAYCRRRHEGNLMDLFPDPSKSIVFKKRYLLHKARSFFRPLAVNVLKLRKLAGLVGSSVYIDNRALDGFLERLSNTVDCGAKQCQECDYCARVAGQVVRVDEKLHREMEERYRECLRQLDSGSLFKYF